MGPEMVAVPGMVGDSAPSAEGKLIAAGLRWKHSEVWSEQVPAGVVMAQNPPADFRVEKGSEVTLTVSKGKEKVAVPNLIGRPEGEAQDAIVNAGLTKTWVNYQDYTTVPPGHVISQEPKAGTLVEKGSTVYIAVRNNEPTPAPSQPPQKKRDD
jgi:serine/threonine-protein kinase